MRPPKEIYLLALCFFMLFFNFLFSQTTHPFIENKGQLPDGVISKINVPSGSIFIEKSSLVYSFYNNKQVSEQHNLRKQKQSIDAHAYKVSFIGSNNKSSYSFSGRSSYYENFYLSNKKFWAKRVGFYKSFSQQNVYSGIDMNMYMENGLLKYDFIVHPKGKPNKIKLKYTGMENLYLKNGDLIIQTSVNNVTELNPYAYQKINGEYIEVPCRYRIINNVVSFIFPEGYNKNEILIIDPTLIFSTYSGSIADNFGYTATYDDPIQFPVGISHVLVNGEFVVRDNNVTRAIPGRAIP